MRKKVGFIYLDELQHIHHFLSPAIELSREPGITVDILTYEDDHLYLQELLQQLGGDKLYIVRLSTFAYRQVLEKLSKRQQPSALYIYKKHLPKLLTYDALVFTDHTAGVVSTARGETAKPKLIYLDHGAGDGAYGYKESHTIFDLVLVAGEKKATRLAREIPDHNFKLKIGGYAKFDVVRAEYQKLNLFANDNPVVLYCPHFSRELSSWYGMGKEILTFFKNHPQYNLIFAPHFNLFNKKGFEKKAVLAEEYFTAANIHIDLGSIRSVNMAYTLNSDIYLGDVSSQVYEFMYRPRPLIFVNAHKVDWQKNENYLMWHAGKVIHNIEELGQALQQLDSWPGDYAEQQQQLFAQTYYRPEDPAGGRIAGIIKEELDT